MNKWIVALVVLAIVWFVALPALGVPQAITIPTFLAIGAIVYLMKGIPMTKNLLPPMPTFGFNPLLIAVVLVVVGIFMFGMFSSFTGELSMGSLFGNIAGEPEVENVATDDNPLASSSNLTIYFADKLTGAAADSTNYAYRKQGESAWVTGSGSSVSITADVGDVFDVAVSPDNTTYYGSLTNSITVPKGYAPKYTVYVGNIATPATVKKTIKNTDSSVNAAATPENMAANDKSTFDFVITGEYQNYEGNAFGGQNIISCKYNTSAFDKVLVQDSSGTVYPSASSPATLTGAAGSTYAAFAIPSIASNAKWEGQLYVEAGSTAPDANTLNITCFIEDAQLFYNSDTNLYEYGVVDEGNSGLGQTATQTNFTLYVS